MITKAKSKKAAPATRDRHSNSLATKNYIGRKMKEEAERVNRKFDDLLMSYINLVREMELLNKNFSTMLQNIKDGTAKFSERNSGTKASPAGKLAQLGARGSALPGHFESNSR